MEQGIRIPGVSRQELKRIKAMRACQRSASGCLSIAARSITWASVIAGMP